MHSGQPPLTPTGLGPSGSSPQSRPASAADEHLLPQGWQINHSRRRQRRRREQQQQQSPCRPSLQQRSCGGRPRREGGRKVPQSRLRAPSVRRPGTSRRQAQPVPRRCATRAARSHPPPPPPPPSLHTSRLPPSPPARLPPSLPPPSLPRTRLRLAQPPARPPASAGFPRSAATPPPRGPERGGRSRGRRGRLISRFTRRPSHRRLQPPITQTGGGGGEKTRNGSPKAVAALNGHLSPLYRSARPGCPCGRCSLPRLFRSHGSPTRQHLLVLSPSATGRGPLNRTRHRVPLRTGVTLCSRR